MTSDNHNKELEPDEAGSGPLDLDNFLQLQLCPPPVSPLGIVPDCVSSSHPVVNCETEVCISTLKVKIYLIHCGMGLFCFPFLARMRFTLKVFKADMAHYKTL